MQAPQQPQAQPVRIGQYRMSKTLGIGSFGKVKRLYFDANIGLKRPGHVLLTVHERCSRHA